MELDFEPIRLDRQEDYLKHLSECDQVSSDYSFANLFGWADEYGLTWAWQNGLVWIRQSIPEECCWAPIGPWQQNDWPDIFSACKKEDIRFTRVPQKLVSLWSRRFADQINVEEERDHWDYIYDIRELIELRGNRFHKKKNLVKQFKKKYDYRYNPFGSDTIEPAMAMQADWCNWKDCESSHVLAAENQSVFKILYNWKELIGLLGGVLVVDDLIVAYTIAEKLDDETIVVHYEKGCPDYKGVYQAINQMFLENVGGSFKWVNREQDLGEDGLRQAKLSYNPVGFLKKYRVTFR
jgi:hypothetical protein